MPDNRRAPLQTPWSAVLLTRRVRIPLAAPPPATAAHRISGRGLRVRWRGAAIASLPASAAGVSRGEDRPVPLSSDWRACLRHCHSTARARASARIDQNRHALHCSHTPCTLTAGDSHGMCRTCGAIAAASSSASQPIVDQKTSLSASSDLAQSVGHFAQAQVRTRENKAFRRARSVLLCTFQRPPTPAAAAAAAATVELHQG